MHYTQCVLVFAEALWQRRALTLQDLTHTLNKKSEQLISVGFNSNTTDTEKHYDNDNLYGELSDLVNEHHRAWFMKVFYLLGKDRVLRVASIARAEGRDKPRYFSWLIKKELA